MSAIAKILLTPDEMTTADAAASASGLDSFDLMERAGRAVAAAALRHWPGALRFVALCGPGNNGGDAYVAAGALAETGADVALFSFGDPDRLRGDALTAFRRCGLPVLPLVDYTPRPGDVVIDGIFGAGLSREVPPEVAAIIARVEAAQLPVLAIDLPSGLCGLRGRALGAAFQAARTVTFMTRKPGHLLMPGRDLCGPIEVFDIGIPHRIIRASAGRIAVNGPEIWAASFPRVDSGVHKYRRGHLAVFSGGAEKSGAARLSAAAGLTAGAGLVTVASPADAMAVQAPALTAVMLRQTDTEAELSGFLSTAKLHAFVIGPGFGIGDRTRRFTQRVSSYPVVVDADAITSFAEDPDRLFDAFSAGDPHLVLTPHEGEFARLFPDLAADGGLGKVGRAQAAAKRAHAAIVYKGADTVIAAPDGRALINENAPPWLATAGSGDVLAGIIGAFLAQGMPTFEAAAAGVWLHGEAGELGGRGLTAETLILHIAEAVQRLG
ncbi:NAD(P)H-hydrate dehydratase [Rhizobium sp. SL86]|uniref:NAD(P)H-hydrate dehydratase n=1 Tax=Rhizobium sp. SL86 TaxID=2995148 RepID=UPI0022766389|nr:NAD(P)H-hydrate dehydratase [Rhizobium sp. SL86]MCY1668774.1 NAD(P)H-hydrate dehydratase [Rhizobium sp. SL86]